MKMKLLLITFLLFLLFPVLLFAGDTDSLGVVGSILVDALSGIPIIGQLALVIYGIIVWLIVRGAQVIFSKIPTKWNEFSTSVGWRILSFLFGKDILLHNAKPDPKSDIKITQEKLKERLKKEYPVLNTPTPWDN